MHFGAFRVVGISLVWKGWRCGGVSKWCDNRSVRIFSRMVCWQKRERKRKRVINPFKINLRLLSFTSHRCGWRQWYLQNRERERKGACSGYLMLSGNKSVSVKKFESYRCCLKKWSFIKREECCVQGQEKERERVGPALSGKYCEAINLDLSKVGSYWRRWFWRQWRQWGRGYPTWRQWRQWGRGFPAILI
jgi:hypothetical protein